MHTFFSVDVKNVQKSKLHCKRLSHPLCTSSTKIIVNFPQGLENRDLRFNFDTNVTTLEDNRFSSFTGLIVRPYIPTHTHHMSPCTPTN